MFNFFAKQLLKSKLKGQVPEEEQEKIFAMLEKNPNFFKQIAEEVQEKVKGGKDQMSAVMEVLQSHQSELEKIKNS